MVEVVGHVDQSLIAVVIPVAISVATKDMLNQVVIPVAVAADCSAACSKAIVAAVADCSKAALATDVVVT